MKWNVLVAAVILGVAIVVAACVISASPSPSPSPCNCEQRFQISVSSNRAFIVDTKTGQAWEKYILRNEGPTGRGFGDPKLKKAK